MGLVIGKQSETLKSIAYGTNTRIFVPQKDRNAWTNDGERTVEIGGEEPDCKEAERRINELIEN